MNASHRESEPSAATRREARPVIRAAALVVVLWVVLILSLLVMGIATTMQMETKIASYSRLQFQCDVLARAGIELARQQLMEDIDPTQDLGADALKELWHNNPDLFEQHPLGEGVFNVRIIPEDGKLNINTLAAIPEATRYFFELLGVPPADLDVVVDSIDDWVDTNTNPRINGAEDEYYGKFEPPYRTKNGPIDRLEELLLVQGMTADLFYGRTSGQPLRDLLTTFSSGKVNVNVAPPIVLAVLLGIELSQAETIISYRNGDDGVEGTEDDRVFFSRQDLPMASSFLSAEELEALQNVLDFKSRFFTIVSEGRIGNVSKTIRATVLRDQNSVRFLAWLEGADALR